MPTPEPIPVSCPRCNKRLRIKAELAGRKVRCPAPGCGGAIPVPLPLDDLDPEPLSLGSDEPEPRPLPKRRMRPVDEDDEPRPGVSLAALAGIAAAILVAVAVLGAGGYYLFGRSKPVETASADTDSPPAGPNNSTPPGDGPKDREKGTPPDSDSRKDKDAARTPETPPERKGKGTPAPKKSDDSRPALPKIDDFLGKKGPGGSTPEPPEPPPGPRVKDLPGAKGPRSEEAGKLPNGVRVNRYSISPAFNKGDGFDAPKDWSQTLPVGTEQVYVSIAFAGEPPDGTQVGFEVASDAGPVILPDGFVFLTIRTGSEVIAQLPCSRKDGLPFKEGNYRITILLNKKPVAHLNWSVKGKIEGLKDPKELTGTQWLMGDPQFGERFEFGKDGTFKVTRPKAMGDRDEVLTGTWKADGDVFTASVTSTAKEKLKAEYRGRLVNDQLWVRNRRQYADADGKPGNLGDWYPLSIGKKR